MYGLWFAMYNVSTDQFGFQTGLLDDKQHVGADLALDGASIHFNLLREIYAVIVFYYGFGPLLIFQVLLEVREYLRMEAQLLRRDHHPLVKKGSESVGEVVLAEQRGGRFGDGGDY